MLHISVRGSTGTPYTITAEGAGAGLRIFCSCTAGARATLCKHVAAVLVGDVSAVEGETWLVQELARRAAGSALLAKAYEKAPRGTRTPVDPAVETGGIDGVVARYGDRLRAAGWEFERSIDRGEFPEDRLALFGRFKNGRPRKTFSVELSHIEKDYDLVALGGDNYERRNARPRIRPWVVRGANGAALGTWSTLSGALPKFLEAAKLS